MDTWEAIARDAIDLLKQWNDMLTNEFGPDESDELGKLVDRLNSLHPPESPYR
jgi:hypothetical protein